MKKSILSLTLLGILFIYSCKKETTAEIEANKKEIIEKDSINLKPNKLTPEKADYAIEEAIKEINTMEFASEELTQYSKKYEEFLKNMVAAGKAQDTARMKVIGGVAKELDTDFEKLSKNLSEEDKQKWKSYEQRLSKQLNQ